MLIYNNFDIARRYCSYYSVLLDIQIRRGAVLYAVQVCQGVVSLLWYPLQSITLTENKTILTRPMSSSTDWAI